MYSEGPPTAPATNDTPPRVGAPGPTLSNSQRQRVIDRLAGRKCNHCRKRGAVFWNPFNEAVQCHRCGETHDD